MNNEREISDLYSEDLQRLTFNSKPVISNLTELANEYKNRYAHVIVRLIEDRIKTVSGEKKLPSLYLLDSIVKNHPDPYKGLFQQNVVSTFAHVFQAGNEKTRVALHKLRGTWNGILTATKLLQLDRKINGIDPAWPVRDVHRDQAAAGAPNIHINPAVFRQPEHSAAARVQEEVKKKELELMELQRQKLELEVEMAKKQIAERKQMMSDGPKPKAVTTTQGHPSPSQVCNGSSLPSLLFSYRVFTTV